MEFIRLYGVELEIEQCFSALVEIWPIHQKAVMVIHFKILKAKEYIKLPTTYMYMYDQFYSPLK